MAKKFSRREFVAVAGMGVAACGISSEARAAAPARGNKPNIVYFFSDTHRWGAMSFTQTPAVQTPFMEQLLSDGVSMDRCYSNLPICTPYRAILMSGRWPYQQGIIANHMRLDERPDLPAGDKYKGNLAWMFKTAGYNTGYFGKSHWGGNDLRPFGFDKSLTGGGGDHTKLTWFEDGVKLPNWVRGETDDSNCTPTVTRTLEWIEQKHDDAKPFFAMISVNPPHSNMKDAPEAKKALYPNSAALPYHPYDELKDFENHQGYHAHISDVDDELGRILAKIDELGIAEDTIIIYTSDHGGMSGIYGLGYGAKRYPEDESSRVPFLIRWPGQIPTNVRLDTLFSTIDHFPTLCSLANLREHLAAKATGEAAEAIAYLDASPGVDLSKNILGLPGGPDPESVFVMHISNMNKNSGPPGWVPITRAVVTKEFTYGLTVGDEFCLYDNTKEYQYPNLVDKQEYTSVKISLWHKLKAWINKAEKPYIDNWFANADIDEVKSWNAEHGHGDVADREIGKADIFKMKKSDNSPEPGMALIRVPAFKG